MGGEGESVEALAPIATTVAPPVMRAGGARLATRAKPQPRTPTLSCSSSSRCPLLCSCLRLVYCESTGPSPPDRLMSWLWHSSLPALAQCRPHGTRQLNKFISHPDSSLRFKVFISNK